MSLVKILSEPRCATLTHTRYCSRAPPRNQIDFIENFRIDPDTGQDQLAECMKRRLCFEDFHEQKIGFMPTYKFNPNSKIYDTSRALRQPSYTVWLIHYSDFLLIFRTEYCIKARHNVVGYFTIPSMIWLIRTIVQFRPFSKLKCHLSNPAMPRK